MKRTERNAACAAALAVLAGAVVIPTMAFAHHPTGGMTPTTFVHGLLSGIGHPVLGPDHLAFIVGTGILVALSSRWMWLPVVFIAGLVPGVLLHAAGYGLGPNELLVGLSVAVVGGAILLEDRIPFGVLAATMLAAGFFHGYAFGETVPGASAAPIIGYLTGLAGMVMAMTAVFAWGIRQAPAMPAVQRVAAGVLVAAGAVFTFQTLIG